LVFCRKIGDIGMFVNKIKLFLLMYELRQLMMSKMSSFVNSRSHVPVCMALSISCYISLWFLLPDKIVVTDRLCTLKCKQKRCQDLKKILRIRSELEKHCHTQEADFTNILRAAFFSRKDTNNLTVFLHFLDLST